MPPRVLTVLGTDLSSGAVSLFGSAFLLALSYHLFVRDYEEPHPKRGFGTASADYRADVPRPGAVGGRRHRSADGLSRKWEPRAPSTSALVRTGPVQEIP